MTMFNCLTHGLSYGKTCRQCTIPHVSDNYGAFPRITDPFADTEAGCAVPLGTRRVDEMLRAPLSVDDFGGDVDAFDAFNATELAGGLKFDQGKARLDLLDPHAIDQLALVLTFGAQKYAAHNWRKGLSKSRLIAAALRHVFAYLRGEDKDPETGLSHAAHAMCCCMFLLGLEHRSELDDRWREGATS